MTPEDHSGGPILCGSRPVRRRRAGRGGGRGVPRSPGPVRALPAGDARAHAAVGPRRADSGRGSGQEAEVAPVVDRRGRPARPAPSRGVARRGGGGGDGRGAGAGNPWPPLGPGPADPARLARCADGVRLAQRRRCCPVQGVPGHAREARCPSRPASPRPSSGSRGAATGVTLGTLALLRRDFAQADAYLARLPPTPDVLADRGLVRLEEQRYPKALEYLDAALSVSPELLPARFNRALALQALQLPFAAAAAMGPVAQRAPGGWATEARRDTSSFEAAKNELQDDDRAGRRPGGR